MTTHPFCPDVTPAIEDDDKCFEVTIRVVGAARVNRLLSWIVRSQAYDDVTSLSVAQCADEPSKTDCA